MRSEGPKAPFDQRSKVPYFGIVRRVAGLCQAIQRFLELLGILRTAKAPDAGRRRCRSSPPHPWCAQAVLRLGVGAYRYTGLSALIPVFRYTGIPAKP
jgi:hypothetical protein